ncbi:glycerol-3-phosphate acyltransferase [Metasolibacillus meyeri]|uniref:Glycerol-3-phosphate acyltransferase n=1 Tax=Metasolibacillus meyeri TaxID=1071052 RepID=A0AAW9NTQ8_9BACL|nr:glycerol-3-phosphate acyltransferase [Metasolibacillus meyeri]MEC1177593.1 glycerol-3-phosphate acyltransferase [Metasolibacillus meyeri]
MMIVCYLFGSYLLGTMMTAWFIGKYYGYSLQQQHSGNLGARNVGRVLGRKAFILTAVGDGLKGVAVVLVGRYIGYGDLVITWAVFCVLLGHLYPFWLRFTGGKGVATMVGALVALNSLYFSIFFISFIAAAYLLKSATFGLYTALIVYSVIVILTGVLPATLIGSVVLVLWKHRKNIKERLT